MPRWTWYDPDLDEAWEMQRNPDQMTTPHAPKNSTIFSRSIGGLNNLGNGVSRVLQFRQQPFTWEFSGNIRSEAMYDLLQLWTKRPNRLQIADHLERTWIVRVDSADFEEQRPTQNTPWRYRYTVKAIIYGQV